jgi:hypothetical protein
MLKGFVWLLVVATVGCSSSGQAPPKAAPATAPTAAAPTPAPAAKQKSTLESQRAPFIDACMENLGSREYCDCGFLQFATVFKDADFEQEPPKDDPRMEQLSQKMREACSDKFPEAKAQDQFMQSCAGNEHKREPYCGCAWTELRKSLSVSDILNYPPGDAKYVEAKKGIPKACKGKYPTDLASGEYLTACKNVGKKTEKQCQCMWKKVIKKFSVEELASGAGDPTKVPDLGKCK